MSVLTTAMWHYISDDGVLLNLKSLWKILNNVYHPSWPSSDVWTNNYIWNILEVAYSTLDTNQHWFCLGDPERVAEAFLYTNELQRTMMLLLLCPQVLQELC
jgi:hypothetical protein